jgi:phenylphosphate carboxylase gamma subunit
VSSTLDKFADQLQVRLGRGQLSKARFSIKVLEEIQRCPAKYL